MDLEAISQIICIFSFCCGAFNFIVIKPLRKSVDSLQKSVEALAATVSANQKEQNEIDKRVVRVEERCEHAHKRIDAVEHEVFGKGGF